MQLTLGLHRVGEAEDTGAGLAALLGANLWALALSSPRGPSEPSFSFPLLGLLGSSRPLANVQSDYRAFSSHCGWSPFCSALCNYASYPTPVLGRCL